MLPDHISDCWSEGDLSAATTTDNFLGFNRLSRRELSVYVRLVAQGT
jgi:hypothetical protein